MITRDAKSESRKRCPINQLLAGHLPQCQMTAECRSILKCGERGFWDRRNGIGLVGCRLALFPRLALLQPKTQDLVILGSCHFLIRPIFDPPDFQGGDERPSTMRRSNAMPLGRGAPLNDGFESA